MAAPQQMEIVPADAVRGSIRPPGSKSITNRALICAAMSDGASRLSGVLDSEDSQVMMTALRQLGISVDFQTNETSRPQALVQGCGGQLTQPENAEAIELFMANSGTSLRFLTAVLAAAGGRYRLDGIERMRQRPVQDLLDGLNGLGAHCRCESESGCPPVLIESAERMAGGKTRVRGDISSQFLSGLLMAAPLSGSDIAIDVEGTLVSRPYVLMTLAVMQAFGVQVQTEDLQNFRVAAGQGYRAAQYAIEPDASAASYFWAAAAITGGQVTVEGLTYNALQGDVEFCRCLEKMGCTIIESPDGLTVIGDSLQGIDVDMNGISDTVQTLAAVALFARGPTTIRGVAHIRHKETDRIGDLARELRKCNAVVHELPDGLRIEPPTPETNPLQPVRIETYNDHRMAMSLALVGLRRPGIVILNPRCTEKTYPDFFRDFEGLARNVT